MTMLLPHAELTAIDTAFARFVSREVAVPEDSSVSDLLYHTALLVSAERAQGNSCVDLAQHAETASPDMASAFVFPALPAWREALLATGRCDMATAPGESSPASAPLTLSPLVLDGTRLYLRRFFDAEQRLARAIRARTGSVVATGAALDRAVPLFRQLFPASQHAIDWQAVAAVAALRSSLVFVTGGPGTGKTTVAARLLALLLDGQPTLSIAVAAPTGRAAARLTEAIGAAVVREGLQQVVGTHLPSSGSTLHRLLGYMPWSEQFRHRRGNPLPHDVIIIDEASMVDVLMMDVFFSALRPETRVIVLGDPDQLASVDTGFVLGDVARAAAANGGAHPHHHGAQLAADYARLSGGKAEWLDPHDGAGSLRDAVVRLRVSYRFGSRPGIGALATAVQEGDASRALDVLDSATYDEVALDTWPETPRPTSVAAELLAPLLPQVEAFLAATDPAEALAKLSRFRILCALRDGDAGVSGLNALIEEWLRTRGWRVEGCYDHRPVLITANDAGLRLFNGDVGVALTVDGSTLVHFATPEGGVRSLSPTRLPAHETAWAMTVHKSQGSEFDHVRFVLPTSDSRILTRELLYTGITRARERVTLVGTAAVVRLATGRSVARSSGLVERLVQGA